MGEIRDAETAGIALRAAMTGHLVLSTLHTNDPVGAIPRLQDMGLSSLELAAALLGVHAQRLVRLNCPACAGRRRPDRKPWPWPGPGAGRLEARRRLRRPAASPGSGAAGPSMTCCRSPPPVRELMAAGAPPAEIEALARRQGKGSLFDHALALARAGMIALEEALRVTRRRTDGARLRLHRPQQPGQDRQGLRLAASEAALAADLAAEGLFLIRAGPQAGPPAGGAAQARPPRTCSIFLLHLATYLEAGVPLLGRPPGLPGPATGPGWRRR